MCLFSFSPKGTPLFLLFCLWLSPVLLSAQDEETVYKLVEYMPHYAGCEHLEDASERKQCSDEKIIKFISENVRYPALARETGVEGTAVVRFVVQEDGSLSEFQLLKDPGAGCGEESMRVVKQMPDWVPGRHQGGAVKVQFTLPIRFKLEGSTPPPPESGLDFEFPTVELTWLDYKIEASFAKEGGEAFLKASVPLADIKEIFKGKHLEYPLTLSMMGKSEVLDEEYRVKVGKDGKAFRFPLSGMDKKDKKKFRKALKPGLVLYFSTKDDRRDLEILRLTLE